MSSPPTPTELLIRFRSGERGCFDQLFSVVYQELKTVAEQQLGNNSMRNELSSTELVHDVYLKLIRSDCQDATRRTHFLAIGAKAMRQILVDRARAKASIKRGGEFVRQSIDTQSLSCNNDEHVLAVEEALERLEKISPEQARIVESRFFGGMTIDEVAEEMGRSKRWVESEWTMIRAWLRSELSGE